MLKLAVALLLALGILISLYFFLNSALHLRLISDDYCTALGASQSGVGGHIAYQYLHWTGAFIAAVINSLLGLWMTSFAGTAPYLPWILISTVVAVASLSSLLGGLFEVHLRWRRVFIPVVALTGYLGFVLGQFGLLSEVRSINFALGYLWVGWMAAGLSQIIPALLFVLAVGLYQGFKVNDSRLSFFLTAMLALILGQFNFVSALAMSIFLAVVGLLNARKQKKFPHAEFILLVLAITGAVLNYFAPGTRRRAALVSESSDLFNPDHLAAVVKGIIDNLASDSLIIAAMLGLSIGMYMGSRLNLDYLRGLIWHTLIMLFAAVAATVLIEILTYSAPWHYVIVSYSMFVVVLFTAVFCGQTIGTLVMQNGISQIFAVVLGGILAAVLAAQATTVISQLSARSTAWLAEENTSIFFIADREEGWVGQCWKDLSVQINFSNQP